MMVGAKGTIPALFMQFCRQFNLDQTLIISIATTVLKDSVKIICICDIITIS